MNLHDMERDFRGFGFSDILGNNIINGKEANFVLNLGATSKQEKEREKLNNLKGRPNYKYIAKNQLE